MGDDGNRQVALTVEQFAIGLSLNPQQFDVLDLKLGGIHGAVNKLAENITEPDTNLAAEIVSLKQEISVGFAGVNQSITNLNNTIFDRSVDLAKWLAAIALAAANPADNTAEVQKLIDEQAASLDSSATAINEALNQAKTKEK